jgi:hypothetical protein
VTKINVPFLCLIRYCWFIEFLLFLQTLSDALFSQTHLYGHPGACTAPDFCPCLNFCHDASTAGLPSFPSGLIAQRRCRAVCLKIYMVCISVWCLPKCFYLLLFEWSTVCLDKRAHFPLPGNPIRQIPTNCLYALQSYSDTWLHSIRHFSSIKYNYMPCWNSQMLSIVKSRCHFIQWRGCKPSYVGNELQVFQW